MEEHEIDLHRLKKLCEDHHVVYLYTFGSFALPSYNPHNDVDLLVQFEATENFDYFDNYMNFKEHLSAFFHKRIDLIEVQTLKNPVLKAKLAKTIKRLYGKPYEEISF